MMADYKFVKIFGERNTGTRALSRMLSGQPEVRMRPIGEAGAMNLPENEDLRDVIDTTYQGKWRKVYRDALCDNEQVGVCPTKAWKHTLPVWDTAFSAKQGHVIFCVRNPYSWLLSLAKRPYHQKGPQAKTLTDFVKRPWLTVSRDNMAPLLRSPMELWNAKLSAYLTFMREADIPTGTIRFENFVARPAMEVKRVLANFEIPHDKVHPFGVSTKNSQIPLGEISRYYATESWKRALTEELVTEINERTDWDLAAKFGYYQLDPSEYLSRTTWKSLYHTHSWTLRSGSQSQSARR